MVKKNILKAIGPGLLWAGAAIGVSHIVQSTTAGASFGFELVWIIIIANILKYPFFEFAPRYAAATGETLIEGYSRLGKWAVIIYTIITISTMFFLMTAVTVVTAGLFKNIFHSEISIVWWSVIIIIVLAGIIVIKKYSIIDRIVKFIIVILAIAVIIAVVSAFNKGYSPNPEFLTHFNFKLDSNIIFLLALIGWMPTAIDVSVWHSVWTIAKKKETSYAPSLKEALLDFNIGYIGTVILSLAFLSLGAIIMYGTGETFSSKGVEFAGQLLSMFTKVLGNGAYIVIAIAALATMLSTTLTCLDAYPRVLEPTTNILFPNIVKGKSSSYLHLFWLTVVSLGSIIIFLFFLENMKTMVTIATVISFLVAPILGWLNLKVVTSEHVPKEARPNKFLIILSWVGLTFLTVFSIYFILIKFVI